MKTSVILASLLVIATSALAHVGGPPPMYVVVDKVVLEPEKRVPGWVQIWGCFTRINTTKDGNGNYAEGFSRPTYGFVYLSTPCKTIREFNEELQEWQKAAGTGKAVAIGSCGEAGCMLRCRIHLPNETDGTPDATYTTGHLKRFGDMYANGDFNGYPEVAALLKFAKERK
ncbi:MAG TPA: hypothetical protein PLN21_04960 [Gemmatales bacterium]|nr:hypothetical protein [Gemmatales bacterium]